MLRGQELLFRWMRFEWRRHAFVLLQGHRNRFRRPPATRPITRSQNQWQGPLTVRYKLDRKSLDETLLERVLDRSKRTGLVLEDRKDVVKRIGGELFSPDGDCLQIE